MQNNENNDANKKEQDSGGWSKVNVLGDLIEFEGIKMDQRVT